MNICFTKVQMPTPKVRMPVYLMTIWTRLTKDYTVNVPLTVSCGWNQNLPNHGISELKN